MEDWIEDWHLHLEGKGGKGEKLLGLCRVRVKVGFGGAEIEREKGKTYEEFFCESVEVRGAGLGVAEALLDFGGVGGQA